MQTVGVIIVGLFELKSGRMLAPRWPQAAWRNVVITFGSIAPSAVVFVIAPFAFKFVGLDAWYYWVLAASVLLTTSVFNAPEKPLASRLGLVSAQRVRHAGPTHSAPKLARNLIPIHFGAYH